MTRYIALVDGTAGAYGVTIPDLPGCTAMGVTTDDALKNAIAAAQDWAADALASGEAMPAARDAETLRQDREIVDAIAAGGALATVPVILDLGKPARANISLDTGLLAAIDEAAKASGLTRSAWFASAAREKIGRSV